MAGLLLTLAAADLAAAPADPPARRPRARDLGILAGRFPPGALDAITDVPGVRVGHATVSFGEGKLAPGKGPARTGVTVILSHGGDLWREKVAAGSFVLNGNGEGMGLMWLQESGIIETPIALTNTLSVGDVQRALVRWMLDGRPDIGVTDDTLTPLVFECDDSFLSDIRGQHVHEEHVRKALASAAGGPVAEGSVGAGTGTIAYEFKAGIGTSSRLVAVGKSTYTVGILVQANHGERHTLRISGVPVGERIPDLKPEGVSDGSIVVVLATDAPLDSRNLSRLAKRAMLGLARTGGVSHHGSGDVAVAFSTANRFPHYPAEPLLRLSLLSDFHLDGLFEAAADATEEAVINSLLASGDMTGRDGHAARGLPVERLKTLLAR